MTNNYIVYIGIVIIVLTIIISIMGIICNKKQGQSTSHFVLGLIIQCWVLVVLLYQGYSEPQTTQAIVEEVQTQKEEPTSEIITVETQTEDTTQPETVETEPQIKVDLKWTIEINEQEVISEDLLAYGSDPVTGKWFAPTVENAQQAVWDCTTLDQLISVQQELRSFLNNSARLNNCKRYVDNLGESSFQWEYEITKILWNVGRELNDDGVSNVDTYNSTPDLDPADNIDPNSGLTPNQMLVLMTDMEQ